VGITFSGSEAIADGIEDGPLPGHTQGDMGLCVCLEGQKILFGATFPCAACSAEKILSHRSLRHLTSGPLLRDSQAESTRVPERGYRDSQVSRTGAFPSFARLHKTGMAL